MRRGYLHRASWLGRRSGKNVGTTERWLSVLGAMALAIYGRRRRKHQLAVPAAAFLLRRGMSGRCPLYDRLGLSST